MKKLSRNIIIPLIAFTLILASCSVEEVTQRADVQKVTERIDIKIDGAEPEYFYEHSIQENTNQDLVDFSFPTSHNQIDFIVRLQNDKTLIVKLFNKLTPNPWEYSGESYGTFAPQDLSTKYKYVTIEYLDGPNGEAKTFVSNIGANIPQGGFLDVFRIEQYNSIDMEILCRINSMTLYQLGNTNNQITINGTFRGALTFL